MKVVDRAAGIPACLLLSCWAAIAGRFRKSVAPVLHDGSRVLFIELSEMGSMVAAYPALLEVCRKVTPEHVYFLTLQQNRKCVDMLKLIPPGNVITLKNDGAAVFLVSLFKCIGVMRALRFDCVIDMELFARISSILAYLSGAYVRVGFHRYDMEGLYRGSLMTNPVFYNHTQHISKNFLALVRAPGVAHGAQPVLKDRIDDSELTIPRIEADPELRDALWKRLIEECPELERRKRIIIMNPNAGDLLPIRAWPLDRYVELARRLLSDDAGTFLILMGNNEAVADAAAMTAALSSNRVVNFAGKTKFEELLPLFEIGDLLITNDSGPAHFASLTPISILVFFGPETPQLYRPLSASARSLFAGFQCSPCLNAYNHRTTKCSDNKCLQWFTVDHVYKEINSLLYNN